MKRDDPAKWCDVDVSGTRVLELRVGDGSDGITADHADWADARLLRYLLAGHTTAELV